MACMWAPILALTGCGGGGGGGGDDEGSLQTPRPVAEEGFDYPRLAAAVTTVQATYVGGMGGGVWSLTRGAQLGQAQRCAGGGTVTLTSGTNTTSDARYVLQACVLAVLPTVSYTGITANPGKDISSYGTLGVTGQALGMPARFTFTKGTVEGTPAPTATGSYDIQNDLNSVTFIAGSNTATYSVTRSHIDGSQTGTGNGATVQLASGSGGFSVRGRQLTYSITSPIAWSVNGPTGGRLMVNAPLDNPPDSKTYVFGAGGSVQVLDVYGTSIGSFLWSGVAFQAALAAANE